MSGLCEKDLIEYRANLKREISESRDISDRMKGTRSCYNADEIKQSRAAKRRRCECCKQLITDEDYQKLDKLEKQLADLTKYGYDNRKLSFIELVCYPCFVKSEELGEIESVIKRKLPSDKQEFNYGTTLEQIRIEINLGMHKSILRFDK